ncbi:MaoC/PaaZ C-terminal domain-containing protein [Devosia sp. FKR38]|uniref:MaoC/PaaZ C-terminal domain-containing protein n=1 Tax=Devosia sp. FKR38 TaxID=2562312 RepID=UPI0014857A87|nr:MaoC/PaaZ C-terminal domain-containing protein [Devosia sp. FKR38]
MTSNSKPDTRHYPHLTFASVKVGDRFVLGEHTMAREELIAFAQRFDPQPFHLGDAAAADHAVFDRLAASGWHTAAVMNLLVGPFYERTAIKGLAGGGVDKLIWAKPVYADDVLRMDMEIVDVRPSRTKPHLGFISMRIHAHNQDDELVAHMTLTGAFETGVQPA